MSPPTLELFPTPTMPTPSRLSLGAHAMVLRGFALPVTADVLAAVDGVTARAPLRHLETPRGFRMSVAMTNCGPLGWVSDRRGYRYTQTDPQTGLAWPPMPTVLRTLAVAAAVAAGFDGYAPDACLINRYVPGARLTLHQDRNERSDAEPIVSVSLGLPATFQFGGMARTGPVQRVELEHGDVVVWGGVDRMRFHGVLPLKAGEHPLLGSARINLTFRTAA